jgi:hypothetical protein
MINATQYSRQFSGLRLPHRRILQIKPNYKCSKAKYNTRKDSPWILPAIP